MTTGQRDAITSPATGLEIYNTDTNQPEVYNGTMWTSMGGGGSAAGADTQVQFNASGVFGADSNLSYVAGSKTLFIGDPAFTNPVVALDGNAATLDLFNSSSGYEIYIPADTGGGYMEGDNLTLRLGPTYVSGSHIADASAKLQIDSTTRGVLWPRMTEAQRDAIVSPAAGLMIYNLDTNKYNFYNGTMWEVITSA